MPFVTFTAAPARSCHAKRTEPSSSPSALRCEPTAPRPTPTSGLNVLPPSGISQVPFAITASRRSLATEPLVALIVVPVMSPPSNSSTQIRSEEHTYELQSLQRISYH